MVKKTEAFAFLLIATLFLGACSTVYRADVTRFHELTPPSGESFLIVAKSEDKVGSLELQSYSAIISDYLRAEGFTPANGDTADVIVKIDFAVSPPIERARRGYGGGPFYGNHFYFRGHYYAGFPYARYSFYNPYRFHRLGFGYGMTYYAGGYSYTVFERAFEMTIEKPGSGVLFEGIVKSIGREKEMVKVAPFLVDAMFTNFPGENGSTERVKIKAEQTSSY